MAAITIRNDTEYIMPRSTAQPISASATSCAPSGVASTASYSFSNLSRP